MVQDLNQLFHIAQKGMEFSSSPHKPQLIAELYSMIHGPVPSSCVMGQVSYGLEVYLILHVWSFYHLILSCHHTLELLFEAPES